MIVDVATDQPYQVQIFAGALNRLTDLVAGANRVAVIHSPKLVGLAATIRELLTGVEVVDVEVPDAEAAKTTSVLDHCWTALARAGMTRNDVVLGLGGGAVTDLAGFVAATWLRGIGYICVPTSVLAMVDAAVGGKTGINLEAGKNLVGAFWQPRGVICDLDLLAGLPLAEVSSGLAEVIKCGFISDPTILDLVKTNPEESMTVGSQRFAELVARAVQVKAKVVAADLHEQTSVVGRVGREALNYGHTIGHAVEAVEKYSWRHGPAVAVGMVWMAEVSKRLLGLHDETVSLHRELLASVGLPTSYQGEWTRLRQIMSLDKKARGSSLRLIGLRAPGQVELLFDPDEQVLEEAWQVTRALGKRHS